MHSTPTTTTTRATAPVPHRPSGSRIDAAIRRRSIAHVASVSPGGRPHVATVVYQFVDGALWCSTHRGSRKARNLEAAPHVAVDIPVRRLPVGPPSTIHFQSTATVLAPDDPAIVALAAAGRLPRITAHGELTLEGGCFVRIPLPARLRTHGLGMSLRRLLADPIGAAGIVERGR